jgi:MarR family 2-MHQ and catechol resistance regulon transcriptional repressor
VRQGVHVEAQGALAAGATTRESDALEDPGALPGESDALEDPGALPGESDALEDPGALPEEADVLARVAGMPVDLAAMAAAANIWRAAHALRAHLERRVLRRHDLSWAGFSALFNLWVWGAMETRELARSMGVSRATVSGVADTLERRGLARREADLPDRRLVRLALTPAGLRAIETVFPRFNEGEAALTRGLSDDERTTLARLLRRVVREANRLEADTP